MKLYQIEPKDMKDMNHAGNIKEGQISSGDQQAYIFSKNLLTTQKED